MAEALNMTSEDVDEMVLPNDSVEDSLPEEEETVVIKKKLSPGPPIPYGKLFGTFNAFLRSLYFSPFEWNSKEPQYKIRVTNNKRLWLWQMTNIFLVLILTIYLSSPDGRILLSGKMNEFRSVTIVAGVALFITGIFLDMFLWISSNDLLEMFNVLYEMDSKLQEKHFDTLLKVHPCEIRLVSLFRHLAGPLIIIASFVMGITGVVILEFDVTGLEPVIMSITGSVLLAKCFSIILVTWAVSKSWLSLQLCGIVALVFCSVMNFWLRQFALLNSYFIKNNKPENFEDILIFLRGTTYIVDLCNNATNMFIAVVAAGCFIICVLCNYLTFVSLNVYGPIGFLVFPIGSLSFIIFWSLIIFLASSCHLHSLDILRKYSWNADKYERLVIRSCQPFKWKIGPFAYFSKSLRFVVTEQLLYYTVNVLITYRDARL